MPAARPVHTPDAMKQHLVSTTSPGRLAWSIVLVSAALGVSSARADAPAWCRSPGIVEGRLVGDVQRALGSDAMDAAEAIVKETCFPSKEGEQRAREVAKAKEGWSRKLGIGDAEWGEVGVWASGEPSDKRDFKGMHLPWGTKVAWSPLDPVEQLAAVLNGTGDGNNTAQSIYFTDALGAKLSETGRLGYILSCIGKTTNAEVEWAMCAPDITRLDKRKVLTEVKASKAPASEKTKIRFLVYLIDPQLADHDKAVKALVAKDPVYGKMFEIAEATRTQWDELWKTSAAVLDLALAMDDARQTRSRKAFDGCHDKVWAAWEAEVATLSASAVTPVPTKDEGITNFPKPAMASVIASPGGYNASVALYVCESQGTSGGAKDAIIDTLGSVLALHPGLRGPRTATHLAIRNAGLVLDDQNASLRYPSSDLRGWFDGSGARGDLAAVAKVEPTGTAPDGITGPVVTVTFTKKFEKQEQCAAAKALNRIAYISPNGDVTYQTMCTKWQTVTVDKTPDPAVVTARSAKGLKPGMLAFVARGEVIGAWIKGSKSPAFLAGVALKK